jgi:hypothetical protein
MAAGSVWRGSEIGSTPLSAETKKGMLSAYFLTVDHGRMTYSISKPSELKGINIFGTLGSRAATEDVSMFAIEGPCFEVTIDKDAAQEFRGN